MRRKSQEVTYYGGGELAVPAGGDLDRAVQGELARGVVGTTRARVQGDVARARIGELQWTAHAALSGVVSLSADELRAAHTVPHTVPHALPRVQAIVDEYTVLALDELRNQGRR
jgi:hypothetical protein